MTAGSTATVPQVGTLHRGRAFAAAVAGLTATFVATSSPIPLYNTYRAEQGFTNADISLTVVAYFAGTILTLLTLSRLPNHLGRKPVAVATMAVLAVGAFLLMNVTSLAVLVAGRFLMGLGAGLASSGLTAYIVDAAPTTPPWLPSVASSQAPNLGLTIGAIGSGALVQYGPWPRGLVYAAVIVMLAACAVWIASSPETVTPVPGLWRSLRPRVSFPRRVRHLLPVATAVVFSTWATGAFYQAFVPALTIEKLGTRNALVMGLVFSAYMAPAVLGAPIGGRFRPQTAQRIGMLTFLVAMTGIVGGLAVSNLPLFIVASIVGGTGQGIAVSASIRGLLHGSQPTDRAPIFGGIYLLSYAGAAIPSFISGQLSRTYSPFQLAIGYGVVALLATLVTLVFAKAPERAGVEA